MSAKRSDYSASGSAPSPSGSLGVVIPTWNEAPLIGDAVESARGIGDGVIVVGAGSPDGTADVARAAGAEIVLVPKGPGIYLRAGADQANGDILLFLHVDARLPPTARKAILDAMRDPELLGGGFLVHFLPVSWFTRILEPGNVCSGGSPASFTAIPASSYAERSTTRWVASVDSPSCTSTSSQPGWSARAGARISEPGDLRK